MRRLSQNLILPLLLAGAAWCADLPRQRIAGWPDEVFGGRPFEVTVAYDIPASLHTVKLHCELKTSGPDVLQAETVLARGRGTHTFRLTAPSRSQARRVRVAAWMGEDWTRALAGVTYTEAIPVLSPQAQTDRDRLRAAAPALLRSLGYRRSERGNVALFADPAFGASVSAGERITKALSDGPAVTRIHAAALSNPFVLTTEHFDALVLPDARAVPADAVRPILGFLRRGGDLVAVGTPAFERRLFRIGDRWLDDAGIRALLSDTPPAQLLYDFDDHDLGGWRRTTNAHEPQATYAIVPGGRKGACLLARIPSLTGWDTFHSPRLDGPFPKGHTLTCFWAKGSARTRQVAVEWVERDGSRWIATVPLTTEWQHHALVPAAFRYWHDSPTPARGGPDDAFRPDQAASLSFGLAFTHTGQVEGEHSYWVDEVGTSPNPHSELVARLAESDSMPPLETLCPAYKFHEARSARSFVFGEAVPGLQQAFAPPSGRSSHVRPRATGFDKGRAWRWEPLVVAADARGRRCGFPATLLVHARGPYAGGAWAAFSYDPADLSPALCRGIAATLGRMLDGVWLLEGGTSWYTCFAGQEFAVGARAANFGRKPADVRVRLALTPAAGEPMVREFAGRLEPGESRAWSFPCAFDGAAWRVAAALERDGAVVDRLGHDLHIWQTPQRPDFVTARDGDFIANGKPWRPHGVNYMPASGIAVEDPAYFEYWLDPFPYDPDVAQTDLERIRDIGLDTISIFVYHRSIESGNLLDILRRCAALGLRVNLSLRPGTPLDFRWDEMRALIERYRLAHNDTVFAYDLAWEPHFRDHAARRIHDRAWEAWIVEQYGSVERAEQDWGVPCPRDAGTVTGPSNQQASTDGPWRVMVAAYRRFLDDLLALHYARARRLVRSVDPNHLVSFRMTVAGDPTISHGWSIPYDFRATAPGVDIVCPEGYGRIGDWEQVKPGAFTVAYARCVAPARPVLWAEFGRSVWDRTRHRPDPDLLAWTADYYDRFYRMALLAESNGTVCWWYPGGFRVGEDSDFGIVDPDGSDRAITKVIRKYAARFAEPRKPTPSRHSIGIDRDAYPGGLPSVYRAVKDEFWRAMDEGKFPALRHVGQGTTSADCPLVAVGNVPCTGHNPPKHLNGLFLAVTAQGKDLSPGDTVAGPTTASVTLVNTGFASWVAAKGGKVEGGVELHAWLGDRLVATVPVPEDVPHLGEVTLPRVPLPRTPTPARLTLRLAARGRVAFGRVFHLTMQ